MGFDGLISFLIRNLPNDTFDEINLSNNIFYISVVIEITRKIYCAIF